MGLKCKTPEDVKKAIAENDVKHVDLRFTDPRGKWQHLTQLPYTIDENAYEDGIFFDGSSIAGWKAINESDMALIPDPTTAVMDPFLAQPTLVLFCDVRDPTTGEAYSRDPRSVAKRTSSNTKNSASGPKNTLSPMPREAT